MIDMRDLIGVIACVVVVDVIGVACLREIANLVVEHLVHMGIEMTPLDSIAHLGRSLIVRIGVEVLLHVA